MPIKGASVAPSKSLILFALRHFSLRTISHNRTGQFGGINRGALGPFNNVRRTVAVVRPPAFKHRPIDSFIYARCCRPCASFRRSADGPIEGPRKIVQKPTGEFAVGIPNRWNGLQRVHVNLAREHKPGRSGLPSGPTDTFTGFRLLMSDDKVWFGLRRASADRRYAINTNTPQTHRLAQYGLSRTVSLETLAGDPFVLHV